MAKDAKLAVEDNVAKLAVVAKFAKTAKLAVEVVKEVVGTCVSMGVTIDGKDPKIVIKEISQGKHDSVLV